MLCAVLEPQPPVAPHPDIAHLAPLLGSWRGTGHGEYPTIDSFDYHEEIHFGHVGRPFLTYRQRTRHAGDGRSLHAETGYLRATGADRVELILAHPTGITEICEGALKIGDGGLLLELDSTHVGNSSSAKLVTAVGRTLRLSEDSIEYSLRMAAVGQAKQHHLSATLHREQN
ncbi:MAG: FABP family protein [Nocardia sp.]|nr:FABP family protein [Nocardia sp.]